MTGTEGSSSDATRASNGEHSGSGHNGTPVTLERATSSLQPDTRGNVVSVAHTWGVASLHTILGDVVEMARQFRPGIPVKVRLHAEQGRLVCDVLLLTAECELFRLFVDVTDQTVLAGVAASTEEH
ncbi:MAG: hypothetical protein GWN84_22510 [Gammaproteobacteria bacterium]|nr:hypothetical protein [Gammaproteobacteria bacterium]NIU06541.1 hypothetical protein [Gammaproteobacteria bacterium]NIV53430.1 hypothetical protein [Gammaproteobacteria bacterium]NIW85408.1 hypothetical protein [Gammaproteobacteria bacterium]NIX87814.1 hypothetical protein [Gammaproteobacteria bacterium]